MLAVSVVGALQSVKHSFVHALCAQQSKASMGRADQLYCRMPEWHWHMLPRSTASKAFAAGPGRMGCTLQL